MNECPECNSKDVRVAIHTDYKECNKCFHYWETSDKNQREMKAITLPKFEKAWSLRKLRSDINPKCACKGGFCYKWEGNEIVKACKTKER